MITNENGEVESKEEYKPFGSTFFSSGLFDRFKFTGKEYDEDLQQYYFLARNYLSDAGRFNAIDPILNPAMSPYVYANNNPFKYVDPTGMTIKIILDSAEGIVKGNVWTVEIEDGVWVDSDNEKVTKHPLYEHIKSIYKVGNDFSRELIKQAVEDKDCLIYVRDLDIPDPDAVGEIIIDYTPPPFRRKPTEVTINIDLIAADKFDGENKLGDSQFKGSKGAPEYLLDQHKQFYDIYGVTGVVLHEFLHLLDAKTSKMYLDEYISVQTGTQFGRKLSDNEVRDLQKTMHIDRIYPFEGDFLYWKTLPKKGRDRKLLEIQRAFSR